MLDSKRSALLISSCHERAHEGRSQTTALCYFITAPFTASIWRPDGATAAIEVQSLTHSHGRDDGRRYINAAPLISWDWRFKIAAAAVIRAHSHVHPNQRHDGCRCASAAFLVYSSWPSSRSPSPRKRCARHWRTSRTKLVLQFRST